MSKDAKDVSGLECLPDEILYQIVAFVTPKQRHLPVLSAVSTRWQNVATTVAGSARANDRVLRHEALVHACATSNRSMVSWLRGFSCPWHPPRVPFQHGIYAFGTVPLMGPHPPPPPPLLPPAPGTWDDVFGAHPPAHAVDSVAVSPDAVGSPTMGDGDDHTTADHPPGEYWERCISLALEQQRAPNQRSSAYDSTLRGNRVLSKEEDGEGEEGNAKSQTDTTLDEQGHRPTGPQNGWTIPLSLVGENRRRICASAQRSDLARYLYMGRCDVRTPTDEEQHAISLAIEGSPMAAAALSGDLNTVVWLAAQGCPWDEGVAARAAQAGAVHIIEWILESDQAIDCPLLIDLIVLRASQAGHVDVLKAVYSWRDDGLESLHPVIAGAAAMVAAEGGHVEVVRWLRRHGLVGPEMWYTGYDMLVRALHNNCIPLVRECARWGARCGGGRMGMAMGPTTTRATVLALLGNNTTTNGAPDDGRKRDGQYDAGVTLPSSETDMRATETAPVVHPTEAAKPLPAPPPQAQTAPLTEAAESPSLPPQIKAAPTGSAAKQGTGGRRMMGRIRSTAPANIISSDEIADAFSLTFGSIANSAPRERTNVSRSGAHTNNDRTMGNEEEEAREAPGDAASAQRPHRGRPLAEWSCTDYCTAAVSMCSIEVFETLTECVVERVPVTLEALVMAYTIKRHDVLDWIEKVGCCWGIMHICALVANRSAAIVAKLARKGRWGTLPDEAIRFLEVESLEPDGRGPRFSTRMREVYSRRCACKSCGNVFASRTNIIQQATRADKQGADRAPLVIKALRACFCCILDSAPDAMEARRRAGQRLARLGKKKLADSVLNKAVRDTQGTEAVRAMMASINAIRRWGNTHGKDKEEEEDVGRNAETVKDQRHGTDDHDTDNESDDDTMKVSDLFKSANAALPYMDSVIDITNMQSHIDGIIAQTCNLVSAWVYQSNGSGGSDAWAPMAARTQGDQDKGAYESTEEAALERTAGLLAAQSRVAQRILDTAACDGGHGVHGRDPACDVFLVVQNDAQ